MTYELLTFQVTDRIATITVNSPDKLNALNDALMRELGAAMDEAIARDDVGAVLLTGAGRAFVAGADIAELADQTAVEGKARAERGQRTFRKFEQSPKPTLAAINGFALGGGCEMSLACDFRLMADNTKIGVPEVRIGALAGAGGVQKLHRLVGRGKAMEWVLLGSHVTPQEALTHGLLSSVHSAAELMPAAMELARRFRSLGARAVAQSKMAVRMCGDADLANARNIGLEALAMLIGGAEWQEGMAAFMEKRPPNFPPLS